MQLVISFIAAFVVASASVSRHEARTRSCFLAARSRGCVVETVAKTAVDVVTLPVKVVSAGVDAVTTSQSEADEKRGREMRKQDEERGKQMRASPRSAAARASRCRPTIAQRSSSAEILPRHRI